MTSKVHTGCEHHSLFHDEGLCWRITSPELEHEDNNDKYCSCAVNKATIRTYERVGYMEPQPYDSMITKKCVLCDKEGLFKIDSSICSACKVISYYNPN
jgi:hypothetical protein